MGASGRSGVFIERHHRRVRRVPVRRDDARELGDLRRRAGDVDAQLGGQVSLDEAVDLDGHGDLGLVG
jgi:hypothetical protein